MEGPQVYFDFNIFCFVFYVRYKILTQQTVFHIKSVQDTFKTAL